jgi:hypothetical protein
MSTGTTKSCFHLRFQEGFKTDFSTQLGYSSLNTAREAVSCHFHIHGHLHRPIASMFYLMYMPTLVSMSYKRSNHEREKYSTNEERDPLRLAQLFR